MLSGLRLRAVGTASAGWPRPTFQVEPTLDLPAWDNERLGRGTVLAKPAMCYREDACNSRYLREPGQNHTHTVLFGNFVGTAPPQFSRRAGQHSHADGILVFRGLTATPALDEPVCQFPSEILARRTARCARLLAFVISLTSRQVRSVLGPPITRQRDHACHCFGMLQSIAGSPLPPSWLQPGLACPIAVTQKLAPHEPALPMNKRGRSVRANKPLLGSPARPMQTTKQPRTAGWSVLHTTSASA